MTDTEKLAREFSEVLREWLTAQEMVAIIRSNEQSKDPSLCASHDYCDANMAMFEAFNTVIGRRLTDEQSNPEQAHADMALWSEAWSLAKSNRFYPKS